MIQKSNIFAKRHTEKLPQVVMYEIDSTGKSCLRKITLRALFQFVNDTIPELNLFTGAAQHFPTTEISPTNPLSKGINVHNMKGNSRIGMPAEKSSEDEHTVIGGLRLRDLRRLDFLFNPNEERAVLIRRHAVLFAIVRIVDASVFFIFCSSRTAFYHPVETLVNNVNYLLVYYSFLMLHLRILYERW